MLVRYLLGNKITLFSSLVSAFFFFQVHSWFKVTERNRSCFKLKVDFYSFIWFHSYVSPLNPAVGRLWPRSVCRRVYYGNGKWWAKKKKSLKGVKRQKELWYSELRGSLLNHNKYVLSEHIFINIIIKLTLKRYCKYRKENEYRERKTHQNKQKKGTSESSRPLITTSDPNQSQTSVTVQTEKGVKPKKQLSLQLYSIHTAKCLLLMFSLTMALKPETVHEKWHYILKKQHQAVWKQRSASNKLNHHYYYLKSYKVLLATSKENQWSKLSFSFFLFLRFLFLVNSDWNQFVFETCE